MEPLELQERRKKVSLRSHIYLSALFNSAAMLESKLTSNYSGHGSGLIPVVFPYCQEKIISVVLRFLLSLQEACRCLPLKGCKERGSLLPLCICSLALACGSLSVKAQTASKVNTVQGVKQLNLTAVRHTLDTMLGVCIHTNHNHLVVALLQVSSLVCVRDRSWQLCQASAQPNWPRKQQRMRI